MQLPRFSFGIGDRFAHEGSAQLAALIEARRLGAEVAPVWNKSNREHLIVHSGSAKRTGRGRCGGAAAQLECAISSMPITSG